MKLPDWKTCVGYLLMIAALVLSLPGVRAVRADEEAVVISVNLVDSGLSCDPSAESGASRSAKVFLTLDRDPSDGPAAVALNNQGYSYQTPSVDPEVRRFEQH